MPNYTYHKLTGLILETYGTKKAFADALGITPATLGKKLHCNLDWKHGEISKSCELLGISMADMPSYFFDIKVKNSKPRSA